MRLSIIIPIYNIKEEKLNRCLHSIEQIKSSLYECILINDGSSYDYSDILRPYLKSKNNFRYFYQQNEGASSARNKGIELSSGDYITFVDGDDTIYAEQFDYIIDNLLTTDLIISDLEVIYPDGRYEVWHALEGTDSSQEQLVRRLLETKMLNGPVCKFIKREFVIKHNIYFNKTLFFGEDAMFAKDLLYYNPSTYYFNKVTYTYYKDSNTLKGRMLKYKEKYILNLICHLERDICLADLFIKDAEQKGALIDTLRDEYIRALFLTSSDAIIFGIFDNDFKESIREAVYNIDRKWVGKRKSKIKFFYYIIRTKKWWILRFYTSVRYIYLRRKGLIR